MDLDTERDDERSTSRKRALVARQVAWMAAEADRKVVTWLILPVVTMLVSKIKPCMSKYKQIIL